MENLILAAAIGQSCPRRGRETLTTRRYKPTIINTDVPARRSSALRSIKTILFKHSTTSRDLFKLMADRKLLQIAVCSSAMPEGSLHRNKEI